MTSFFGAIADDFTGATDLAALLARSGVEVSLRLGIPDAPPDNTARFEIIALKCRTAPVEDALREALQALEWLQRAGAQRFFWKYCSTFDSTPKGNIGPVAEALMQKLGSEQTIYCPAFPENGRAVFMGNLFVGEQPLAESPMKDHPLTPMRDSNLMRLLTPQVSKPVGLVNRLTVAQGASAVQKKLDVLRQQGIVHVVVDAVANDDLAVIADACSHLKLITGGSALAMPLPALWQTQGLISSGHAHGNRKPPNGPALILSGSCSAMTNRQVAHFQSSGQPSFKVDPLSLAEQGPSPLLDWLSKQSPGATPMIYATAPSDAVQAVQAKLGTARAGQLVEAGLAQAALKARQLGYRRFVVAGGETSGAVSKALGITRLDVGPEIAPGVPWCFASSSGESIAITLKSGNFGQESFFTDALRMLKP